MDAVDTARVILVSVTPSVWFVGHVLLTNPSIFGFTIMY